MTTTQGVASIELQNFIDHTNLKATATRTDIERLCKEAVDNKLYAVCVNGCHVEWAVQVLARLRSSRIDLSSTIGEQHRAPKVAAVVGFPLGQMTLEMKASEAAEAVRNGADEIDMVIRVDLALEGEYAALESEIRAVRTAIGPSTKLKVILETCYLSDDQIQNCCLAAKRAKADFVKTSTGFGQPSAGRPAGATLKHVELMVKSVRPDLEVKASGGIKDREFALQLIAAGATRLGTSSSLDLLRHADGTRETSSNLKTGSQTDAY